MSINEKLAKIAELLKTGERERAAEVADSMIICSAAEQGGAISGHKMLRYCLRFTAWICALLINIG